MDEFPFYELTRKNIQSLEAYIAKDIPCRIKLDANESPYCPISIDSISSMKEFFLSLNRYPDPEAKELKKLLSKNLNIAPENLLLGNGSDEIICYLITTFGGPILYPSPTFVMYAIASQASGQKHRAIPLDEHFDLDIDKILKTIKKEKPKLIFLSSPNNPTGNCFSTEKILKIIESSKNIVVIDEAYQPFSSKRGFLPLLKDYPNLAILRTFSKIGLAAIRTGFLIGHENLIREVNKVRLPYNIGSLPQAIAIEAIRNKKVISEHIKAIIKERERLFKELSLLEGVKPFPSEANFILFKVKDAENIHKKLIEKGILVRYMGNALKDSLRVTVGTPEENNAFIDSLKDIIDKLKNK
ncbi:MAG: histidinol-phosphate transaminase [Thermodesulfovibrionales bacterium]|nr:histidinol-phosphate transaminase [Thermodesulfovibrionales bacterium]